MWVSTAQLFQIFSAFDNFNYKILSRKKWSGIAQRGREGENKNRSLSRGHRLLWLALHCFSSWWHLKVELYFPESTWDRIDGTKQLDLRTSSAVSSINQIHPKKKYVAGHFFISKFNLFSVNLIGRFRKSICLSVYLPTYLTITFLVKVSML